MTIMYFTIGDNLDMYVQALFSIVSFKNQLDDSDNVVAVTTNPDYFNHLSYVKTIVIDDKMVAEWRGKHDFFWRTKIKAIEYVTEHFPADDIVYLDCDTFLYGDITELKKQLASGNGFMDGDEGHPSRIKYKPKRMYKKIAGHQYADITISKKHDMWCAGVVAIPREKADIVVKTALTICDGMLDDGAEPIVVEQYSLSVAMTENTQLMSSKPFVAHYWGNKPQWIDIAKNLIVKSLMTKSDLDKDIAEFSNSMIKETPVYVKKHNTNRKLKGLVDKMFPDSHPKYIE